MGILSKLILVSHIVARFAGLALFWAQAYARKGGRQHRKVGRLYVRLMWVVVVTAVTLCIISLQGGRTIIAIFLSFIALITAKPLWLGTSVLTAKTGQIKAYRVASLGFDIAVVSAGGAMVAYGLHLGGQGFATLLLIFGGLGLANSADLWSSIKMFNSSDTSDWTKQHIASMGSSGIAAHTAFLVFGANSLLPDVITQSSWSIIPWITPAIVGTLLIRLAVRKYQPSTIISGNG